MHLVATLDLGPIRTMIKGMDYAASQAFHTRLAGELNVAGAAAHAAMIAPLKNRPACTGTRSRARSTIGRRADGVV